MRAGLTMWIAASILVLLLSAPASAQELPTLPVVQQPDAKAKKQAVKAYKRAQGLYERGQYGKAAKPARRAYSLVPSFVTSMALTNILAEMGLWTESFRQALITSELATPRQRADANIALIKAGPRMMPPHAAVRLVVPSDATVSVGNVRFKGSRTVGLIAGEHTIAVSAPGKETQKKTVTARLSTIVLLEVKLAEPVAKPPDPVLLKCIAPKVVKDGKCVVPAGPAVASAESWEPSVGPWVLIGVGGAALVAGGVLLALTQGELDSAGEFVSPVAGLSEEDRRESFNGHINTAQTYYYGGFIVGGVGLAAVLGGVIWKVLDTPPDNTSVGFQLKDLGPWTSRHSSGVLLRGVF